MTLPAAPIVSPASDALIDIRDLAIDYRTADGDLHAVDRLSLAIGHGEAVGLVGESGCGKSTLALALMRLLPHNAAVRSGAIILDGQDLLRRSDPDMRRIRWNDIAIVFQGAMNAFNPVRTLEQQIDEAMRAHGRQLTRRDARTRIGELLELVELPPETMRRYPHECSGGMRQRAALAMALSCEPRLIIADEVTTALDVIVQDRILRRLRDLQHSHNLAVLYISHDIAAIGEVSDRLAVMYGGRIAEVGPTGQVLTGPRHPYSASLVSSMLTVHGPPQMPTPLAGDPPSLSAPPSGCLFHPRCPLADDRCIADEPPLNAVNGTQHAACWHTDQMPTGQRIKGDR